MAIGEPTVATVDGRQVLCFVYAWVRGIDPITGYGDLDFQAGFVEHHGSRGAYALRMAHALALLTATALLAAATAGQARQPLFGRVLVADGAPLADAIVTLVEDDVGLVGADPVDVVTVTTDARGRFVAQALRGVRYSAFAVGPTRDGAARVAPVVRQLACGRPAELRATVTARPRRVQLAGLEQWGAATALRVRLTWSGCPGHHVDLDVDARGGVEVPASSVVAEPWLCDAEGHWLGRLWLPPSPDAGAAMIPQAGGVDVRVLDAAGAPVPGATVTHRWRQRIDAVFGINGLEHRDGAPVTTDADGRAHVRFESWQDPFETLPDTLIFAAAAPGHAEGSAGWVHRVPFTDGRVVEGHEDRTVRITLRRPTRAAPESAEPTFAARRGRLFALGTAEHVGPRIAMTYWAPRAYDVAFDAEGRWTASHVTEIASRYVLRVPPVDGRQVLLRPQDRAEAIDVALSSCTPLALHLLDATGGPAGDADVLIVPLDCRELAMRHAVPLVPDQAGRVDVMLQGGRWSLVAMDETTWAHVELDEWSATEPLEVRLAPKPSRRVRVVDGADRPVAGAKFEPGSFATAPSNGVLAQLGWNAFGGHVRRATTDEKGEALLHFLPLPGTLPTVFAWRGDHRTRSDDVALVEDDDVLVFRLR